MQHKPATHPTRHTLWHAFSSQRFSPSETVICTCILIFAYFLLLENQLNENTNQACVVTHHTYLASINISEWKADRKEHVSVDYKVIQEDSKNSMGLERQIVVNCSESDQVNSPSLFPTKAYIPQHLKSQSNPESTCQMLIELNSYFWTIPRGVYHLNRRLVLGSQRFF